MRSRRPRKAIGPGDAWREAQRTAKIRKQQDDERQRHQSVMTDLALRRQKTMLQSDPERRSIELARINAKQFDENYRYQSKMESLTSRIFRKT